MVRTITKFLRDHADPQTQALYRTFVINEKGAVNENTALAKLVKLNYNELAEQADAEITEFEAEMKATKTKSA